MESNSSLPSSLRDGWFSETEALWPGQKLSLALEGFTNDSVLYCDQSEYQHILVFKSAQYGNVLVLDGVIQCTERDEFAYHEMMAHLSLFAHVLPKNVLIVGGGDGGILREVARHSCVETITMVEIDPKVIEIAKEFFSESTATAFDDPRLLVVHEDAAEYLRRKTEEPDGTKFDIIIADTSDPVGPAETLFHPGFYESMYDALNDGGIVCAQAECIWIHMDYISDMIACCADIFDSTEYAMTTVPTFPCGQIGFVLAGKGLDTCSDAVREITREFQSSLRWYNPSIHRAAFALPQFVQEKFDQLVVSSNEQDEENVDSS